jgi:hypothetical protein
MKTFAVYHLDFDDVRQERMGAVSADDTWQLKLVKAEPDATEKLQRAIKMMNDSATLLQKVPPADDAPKFSIRKEKFGRDDPGFFGALQDNLRRWHNMELVAEQATGRRRGG